MDPVKAGFFCFETYGIDSTNPINLYTSKKHPAQPQP